MANFLLVLAVFTWISTCNGSVDNRYRLKYFETLSPRDLKVRVKRGTDPNPASHLYQVWFSTLGRDFHLVMKQASIFSTEFRATVVDGKGRVKPYHLDKGQFFTGKLHGDEESDVRAHWEDNILTASITTPSDVYVVEPSWRILPPSHNHSIIAYRQSDIHSDPSQTVGRIRERFCGGEVRTTDKDLESSLTSHREPRQTSTLQNNMACRMFVVADFAFHKEIGGLKTHKTAGYIVSLLNRVNAIYHKTRWPDDSSSLQGLGLEIAELKIHENYTYGDGEHYNMPNRKLNTTRLLQVFSKGTEFKGHCLAHLFTYQSFGRGVLGLAYIASHKENTPGGICSKEFKVNGVMSTLNTGWSSSANSQGNRVLSLEAALVTAHEIGHNWGSEHDSGSCSPLEKDGGPFLMYPYSVSGYDQNNKFFSTCSRRYIYEVLKSKHSKGKSCFTNSRAFTFCGNGRKEEGEECDAGVHGDKCCDRECKLIGDAICSPWNFECCSKDCQVEQAGVVCHADDTLSCKSSAKCDGKKRQCPEPNNKDDNTSCVDNGRCVDGTCVGYCELRGKTACICTQESGHVCHRCCRKPNETLCEVQDDKELLPDGRPCYKGYCVQGKCEKQIANVVQRLFSLIDNITADKLVEFMKSNIVGTIVVFSLILWVPLSCIFSHFDKKKEKKYRKSPHFARSRSNYTLLEDDKNQVWHYGSLKLKHGGSIVRRQNLITGYPDRESRV